MLRALAVGLLLILLSPLHAEDEWWPGSDLQLETHGFASFGYLDTWGNNWLGPTRGGTTQFWEAAANAVARPVDRLRIGAQVYVRDLVNYDNGQVSLDWAYADYRFADWLGIQVGRVKIPIGLYNEDLDVNVSHASVFLPTPFYSLIDRDLYIADDGAKIYGHAELASLGSADYAAYGGTKSLRNDGAFATHYSTVYDLGEVDSVKVGWAAGCMAQWNSPVHGLALRLSLANLHDLRVTSSPSGMTATTQVTNYYESVLSVLYEMDRVTLAAEYQRLRGRGETSVQPINHVVPLTDYSAYGYVSATWHLRRWLELYGALEQSWADVHQPSGNHSYAGVAAINVLPLPNWSIKAEFQEIEGTMGVYPADNPQGLSKHWQILALKTSVDF